MSGISAKFPTTRKPGSELLTMDEFELLLELSGDKNRTLFIHRAIRHYASVIRDRIADEQSSASARGDKIAAFLNAEGDMNR